MAGDPVRPPPVGSGSPDGRRPLERTETSLDVLGRLAPGTLVGGRYRVVRLAGVGGMGVVYRARDEELAEDVAVKVLRPDLGTDPRALERFRGELVLGRQVSHRNVVRIHDIGEHEGLRFLTMRYVEGRSVAEILEKEGPLPLERATRIVRQVAEGLAEAHDAGIVHRDLKPGNVLVDEADNAFITDFGVARSLEGGGLTRAGAVVGTPDYLSPEQIAGDPVDGRTDLYALGLLFYEMLSGQLPFRGGSQAETLAQRLAGRPRDLSETGTRAPAPIRAVIRRCLERSPERRYANARAFLQDLDRAAASRTKGPEPRRIAIGLAVAAAAVAAGIFLWRERSGREPPAAPLRAAVALLPLADESARQDLAWAGTGIAEMLAANLSETPGLRVVDPSRVFRGVEDLKLEDGRYDTASLRQVADLWNVNALVTGAIRRAGSRLRVDLALHRFEPGEASAVRHVSEETATAEGLFRLVSLLAGRLRSELGVSRWRSEETPDPGTESIAAARDYQQGRERLVVGDTIGAAPLLERAVAADPRFGAALERLSEAYQSLGYQEKALAAARRAVAAFEPGSSRLARRARARLSLLSGKALEAEKLFAELAARYPSDTELRLDLAGAQAAQGHHADAVATLQRTVELDPKDPRAWLLLGRNATLVGDGTRAVQDYLVRALALQTQLKNEKGRADVLTAMAGAYQGLGEHERALEQHTAALEIRGRFGDEPGMAANLTSRAHIYQALGRAAEAERDLTRARVLFEKTGDRLGLSAVWNAVGVLQESRGAYRKALEAYQTALKLRRDLGNERLLAQSYDNVGYIFYLTGEYDNALVYWQQALERRRKIGEKSGVVLSVQNLGFLQLAQGRASESLKSFLEALEKGRETGQKDAVAISLGNLGILYHWAGRPSAALKSFDEALAVARELELKGALAEFTLKKASLMLDLGAEQQAGELLTQAGRWLEETENQEQSADREILLGEWRLLRRERKSAREAFSRAIPLAKESGSRASFLHARIAAAAASPVWGEASRAEAALAEALAEAEGLGHALLTIQAGEALARTRMALRRPRDAAAPLQKALQRAEETGWEAGLYRLYACEAELREASGNPAGAAESWRKSAERLARLRAGIPEPLRDSFDTLPAVKKVLSRTPAPAGT